MVAGCGYLHFLNQLVNIFSMFGNDIKRTPYLCKLLFFHKSDSPLYLVACSLSTTLVHIFSPFPRIINDCWGELWLDLCYQKCQIWDRHWSLCWRQYDRWSTFFISSEYLLMFITVTGWAYNGGTNQKVSWRRDRWDWPSFHFVFVVDNELGWERVDFPESKHKNVFRHRRHSC